MIPNIPAVNPPKYFRQHEYIDQIFAGQFGLGAPYQVFAWENPLYRRTTRYPRQGVLWHSTGANNRTIKRYVQSCDGQTNFNRGCTSRARIDEIIGYNPNGNDWCHGGSGTDCSVHAFIGLTDEGTVEAFQIYEWDMHVNGAGSSLTNNGWIQFEICDYCYQDQGYADACIEEGCQLTAYLFATLMPEYDPYDIGPSGLPRLTTHDEAGYLGLADWHQDPFNFDNGFGDRPYNHPIYGNDPIDGVYGTNYSLSYVRYRVWEILMAWKQWDTFLQEWDNRCAQCDVIENNINYAGEEDCANCQNCDICNNCEGCLTCNICLTDNSCALCQTCLSRLDEQPCDTCLYACQSCDTVCQDCQSCNAGCEDCQVCNVSCNSGQVTCASCDNGCEQGESGGCQDCQSGNSGGQASGVWKPTPLDPSKCLACDSAQLYDKVTSTHTFRDSKIETGSEFFTTAEWNSMVDYIDQIFNFGKEHTNDCPRTVQYASPDNPYLTAANFNALVNDLNTCGANLTIGTKSAGEEVKASDVQAIQDVTGKSGALTFPNRNCEECNMGCESCNTSCQTCQEEQQQKT